MADKAITIDLTDYKDRVGSRVPEGRYNVTVEDVEQEKSSNGNPYLTVWFRILNGEQSGSTVIDRLFLTQKSLWRLVAFMQAIGLPTPKKKIKLPFKAIVGKNLTIEVEDGDPYNGRVRSEVQGFMPLQSKAAGNGEADPSSLDVFKSDDGDDDEPEADVSDTDTDDAPDEPEVEATDDDDEDSGEDTTGDEPEVFDLDEITL